MSNVYRVNITCPRCQFRGDIESDFPCEHDRAHDRSRLENARMLEALTPSAETKAAYIGEFFFLDENGSKQMVPWTTVKEIMAAILGRATRTRPTEGGPKDE